MAYIGEIQLFAFGYAPPSWQLCDGSLLQTRSFASLFALIGNTYGGDGVLNFRVPNLIGRAVCSAGTGTGLSTRELGKPFGVEQVTLTDDTAPPHAHGLGFYSAVADTVLHNVAQEGNALVSPTAAVFVNVAAEVDMKNPIDSQGSGTAHENRQPYTGMTYYILADSRGGDYPEF